MRRRWAEEALDLLHVRLLSSSVGCGLLTTLVLIALRMDGALRCPPWVVLIPLWVIGVLLLLSLASLSYVYAQRHNTSSIFHGLYPLMRGAAWVMFDSVVQTPRPRRALAACFTFVALGGWLLVTTSAALGQATHYIVV